MTALPVAAQEDDGGIGWLHLLAVEPRHERGVVRVLCDGLDWDETSAQAFIASCPRTLPCGLLIEHVEELVLDLDSFDVQATYSEMYLSSPSVDFDDAVLTPLQLVDGGAGLRFVDPRRSQAPMRLEVADAHVSSERTAALQGMLFSGTIRVGDAVMMTPMGGAAIPAQVEALHVADLDSGAMVSMTVGVAPGGRQYSMDELATALSEATITHE